MKKFLLFLFSLATGFAIFYLVTKKIGWKDIGQVLSLFRHWEGIVIFLITLLIGYFNTWRWKIILETKGLNTALGKLADIFLGGWAIGYLTPSPLLGGEFFLGLGLKRKFNFPWEKGIASVIILEILSFSIILLFLIFGIFSLFFLVGIPPENIGLIFIFAILGLTILLLTFYYRSFRRKSILGKFWKFFGKKYSLDPQGIIETEKEILAFFRPKNKIMWRSLKLAFLVNFLNLLRFWLIIFFLRWEFISFSQILIIFAFIHLAYILPFPAALGSLEASQTFIFNSLGLDLDLATAFCLILRGAELSLALIGLFLILKLWSEFNLEKFGIFKK